MPDDIGGERVASEGSRTIVALSERVAVVETKVGALKEDTGVIRHNIHEINNRMTEFVALETKCANALNDLLGMKPIMDQLLGQVQQGKGAWKAIGIVGTALMGAVSIGAVIASGIWWLLHVR